MKAKPVRAVLGFYAADEGDPRKVYETLRRTNSNNVCLYLAGGQIEYSDRKPCERYADFRLEGESLIVAEAPAEKVRLAVQQLRSEGSPAIFVVAQSLAWPALAPKPVTRSEESIGDIARRCARERGQPGFSKGRVLASLREYEVTLDSARRDLLEAARLEHALTAAAEWLLDNGYLVRTQIAEIARHLPKEHYKILPASASGYPYIYELATCLVAHTDCVINEANIREALREYQTVAPLTIAELWSFSLLLRMALIEALAKLAARVCRAQQLREGAYFWANRLAASARRGPEVFARTLQQMETEPSALEPYFVTCLAEQLQDEENALAPVQHWIEERLKTSLTEMVRAEHTREATESVSTANAFGSLRTLSRIDFTEIFESVSLMEAELRRDPGGVYPISDFSTRDQCRRVVEQISRYSGEGELDVARRAVALAGRPGDPRAGHVAYYLLDSGVTELEAGVRARIPLRTRSIRALRKRATPLYITGIIGLTASFTAIAIALAWDAGVRAQIMLAVMGLLSLFPLSELSIQIINALVISLLPPDLLPKLEFEQGIPPEHATLVVVPMMLSNAETVRRELEKLEVRFLASRETNLFFSLFSDFTDAPAETAPGDQELLAAARDGIAALNARFPGGRFLLFHRGRAWSESEQRWIGRERKRGKIDELNAYLNGETTGQILAAGSLPLPIRYVITLDADTQLPPGAARRMVETIAYPLNRVETDPETGIRRRGFTIIQPRVSIALPGATASRFTRVFADTSGTDPYCQTVSDAQQDLFREAIYHGKAIYDVRAFRSILGDRFPPETLLSHDLIEGSHAGVGLATDIELFENLPLDYVSFSQRQHRWIRGDWQIAPWMFGYVPAADGKRLPNPLPVIGRWRIFDNLRRSLVPVASLLLLLFGWLISAAPGVWSLVVGLAVAIPAIAPLLDRLARWLQGTVHGMQGATDELVRTVVMVAFLPHQAWLSIDAIGRVWYRRAISHRNLLEWQTAESAAAQSHKRTSFILRQMWMICGASLLLMIVLQARHALGPTAAFLVLWAASPALIRWLDRPVPVNDRRRLPEGDMLLLRRLARRTWRYFDDLVGPETHWLPPDNSQLALRVEVAQRTSPTNIGLWLTSALAARDLGYLTAGELLRRCSETMTTLGKLERYEGHLLNWYDTGTLAPLTPRYVSTVDSGNLLASLWVLAQGCEEAVRSPIVAPVALRGLSDTLAILNEVCGRDPSVAVPLRGLRRLLRGKVEGHALVGRLRLAMNPVLRLHEVGRWQEADGDDRAYWTARLSSQLGYWTEALDLYLRWMETLAQPPDSFVRTLGEDAAALRRRALSMAPSLKTLAEGAMPALDALLSRRGESHLRKEVLAWLDQLASEYATARANAAQTVRDIAELVGAVNRFAAGVNMGFLYDTQRRLFGVGYLVGGPREFSSHYDLLASECRLASLIAIAKGDVPIEHWPALGRPHVPGHGGQTMLSWSGTMFEYLMPLLFTRSFTNSMLDRACHAAVRRQIEYGREKGVPWGVSESAYSALDSNQIYQYRAFGVPGLALKHGLEDDLVVAPYATMLALLVDPLDAIENIKRLKDFGMGGPMGLYEAIDFTRESKRDGERGVVIYSYMAHHQGMSLLALDDILHGAAMQRRFHDDLRIRAFESLLFERVPQARLPLDETQTSAPVVRPALNEEPAERAWKEDTAVPRVHLQGNGRYALMLTNSGGGYSRWNDFDLTRWRSDTTLDNWGSFLYIRDVRSGEVWAAAHQPVGGRSGTAVARFSADRAEFQRRVGGIETVLDVTVATEDDAELRRLTVTNRSLRSRLLEFTTYAELALAPHAADKSHPAFSKMFIETECLSDGVLIAHRRLRSPDESPVWAAHILLGAAGGIEFETDRERFLGRGNTPERAAALRRDLTGSIGTVLDPIFSLRCRVTIEPRDRLELSFITLAAGSREALLALIQKYRRPESIARAFEMAWTRAQLEFRFLGIGPSAAHRFDDLASHLLYPNPRLRPLSDRLTRNRLGQSALWGYGISGDYPILAVTVAESRSLSLVRELLLAHAYWRLRGFKADFVILNQEGSSYERPLMQQLVRQIEAHSPAAGIDKPGGVFLRDWNAIPEDHRNLILAAAGAVLSGSRGPLQLQLLAAGEVAPPPPFVPSGGVEEPSHSLPFLELPYFNGLGGFTPDGREYAIYLAPGSETPAPWVNVMANASFGALVSESGLGCAWYGNSQTNRLTPWHNDPVTDTQSEIIYLRDEESGAIWTPTALPIREKDAHRARHGQGYTVFEHNSHAISQDLTVFVPAAGDGAGDPVKVCRLRLRNDSSRRRRLTVTYFAEWVLGSSREDLQLHIQSSRDEVSGALLARQPWNGPYPDRLAFAASSPRAASYSCDRTQFLGRNGSTSRPAALGRIRLDNRCGAGLDPCAALQIPVNIEPGGFVEVVLLLGQAESVEQVRALVGNYQAGDAVERALTATREHWDSTLGALQVSTPLLSADLLLNRWLLYQTMSCRFWGRTALYQSSGALGFRDQLQDSMAFLYAAPELTRGHILAAAARQFPEGDVQHWWHADTGAGVRTRCSDDLAWLPFVVSRYIESTGDTGVLDEPVSFLDGPPLAAGEQEHMFVPAVSFQKAPLWDHCRRALEHAVQLGSHGLPLIGNGDWNDGMNRVGVEGRGESVWLAWFLATTLDAFAAIMERRDGAAAAAWRVQASALVQAVERCAWDGDWYLRGFFDNGAPLGSHANPEARIDSLPQSWAVISGAANPGRARQAMDAARSQLVDERNRLVRLFTPPFDHSEPNPGYIMGYPPGLRENGGQYTHGSLWLALARARMGEGAAAVHLLKLMNPVELSRNPEDTARYRVEPYVASADVYDAPGKVGRGGWTWYTGSSGWMYRIWIEEVLGFRLRGDSFTLHPVIPDDWPGFEILYRHQAAVYKIEVLRKASAGPAEMEIDGKPSSDGIVPLTGGEGEHSIRLRLPSPGAPPVPAPAFTVTLGGDGSNGVSMGKPKEPKPGKERVPR